MTVVKVTHNPNVTFPSVGFTTNTLTDEFIESRSDDGGDGVVYCKTNTNDRFVMEDVNDNGNFKYLMLTIIQGKVDYIIQCVAEALDVTIDELDVIA